MIIQKLRSKRSKKSFLTIILLASLIFPFQNCKKTDDSFSTVVDPATSSTDNSQQDSTTVQDPAEEPVVNPPPVVVNPPIIDPPIIIPPIVDPPIVDPPVVSNAAPVVSNLSVTTQEDNFLLSIALPGTDSNGDKLYYEIVTVGTLGSVSTDPSFNTPGTFSYVPKTNVSGIDTFTYRAYDGQAYSNTAIVTVTITTVNDSPIASNYNFNAPPTQTDVLGDLKALVTDAENDPVTYTIVTTPTYGTVTLDSATGKFTYVRTSPIYYDSFTYYASDGNSKSATVTAGIMDPNGIPRLQDLLTTNGSIIILSLFYQITLKTTVNGSLYIAGAFTAEDNNFDNGNGMFVARLTSDNKVEWGHVYHNSNSNKYFDMSATKLVVGKYNVHVAGRLEYGGTLSTGGPTYFSTSGTHDASYIVSHSRDGTLKYIKNFANSVPAIVIAERIDGSLVTCLSPAFTADSSCVAFDNDGIQLWKTMITTYGYINFLSSTNLANDKLEVSGIYNYLVYFENPSPSPRLRSECSTYFTTSAKCSFKAVLDMTTGAVTSFVD